MRLLSIFSQNRGFTAIEVAIAVGIFSLVIALGLFMSMETYRGTMARSERDEIVSLLSKARSRSMNNISQTRWGFCFDDTAKQYVLFRDTFGTSNESIPVGGGAVATSTPTGVSCSEGGVLFSQLSATTSDIVVHVYEQGRYADIAINHEGRIDW